MVTTTAAIIPAIAAAAKTFSPIIIVFLDSEKPPFSADFVACAIFPEYFYNIKCGIH